MNKRQLKKTATKIFTKWLNNKIKNGMKNFHYSTTININNYLQMYRYKTLTKFQRKQKKLETLMEINRINKINSKDNTADQPDSEVLGKYSK